MSYFASAPLPVRRSGLPDLVRSRVLVAVQPFTFTADAAADPRVHTEQKRPQAPAEVKPPWGRVTCMIPRSVRPRQGTRQNPQRAEEIDLTIRCEVASDPEGKAGWEYAAALENMRDAMFPRLQGWEPYPDQHQDIETGAHYTVRPAEWQGQAPDAPGRADRSDLWFLEYTWTVILARMGTA